MKFIQKILIASAALIACVPAFAGQGDFDYFGAPKTLTLTPSTVLTESGNTALNTTNIANISRYLGIVCLDVASISNSVASASGQSATNAFTVYSSTTGTNGWVAVTNWLATSTTVIYTNYWGITNASVAYYTNTFQVPGTITYPTVGTAGFSGQYTIPPTVASTLTATSGASSNWTYGFDADNCGAFLEIVYQTTGSNSVYDVTATLRGRTKGGVY